MLSIRHQIRFAATLTILLALVAFFSCVLGADLSQLRISLPPGMGSLPIALAQEWELFEEYGLAVDLVGLRDNEARNLAIYAGDIDGMVCDVTLAIMLASIGADIVITSTAYRSEGTGSLALLSQSYFNIDSVGDLLARTQRGSDLKSIAILESSDIEYHIDMLLASLGYPVDSDKYYSYWNDMVQLAAFLSMGSVYAAVLPEPYITYLNNLLPTSANMSLVNLSDFDGIDLLPSIIVFRRAVIEEKTELVERFYAAYREAVRMLNGSSQEEVISMGTSEAVRLFFPGLKEDSVPVGIMDSFEIPQFPQPQMLSEKEYENARLWVAGKHDEWQCPSYEEITTDYFLQ